MSDIWLEVLTFRKDKFKANPNNSTLHKRSNQANDLPFIRNQKA